MKKFFAVLLALSMVFALAACTSGSNEPAAEPEVDIFAKGEGVMTYAEYAAADLDTEVTVETFLRRSDLTKGIYGSTPNDDARLNILIILEILCI